MTDTVVRFEIFLMDPLLTLTSEELLIDFRELIGEHSGENMAAVLWSTVNVGALWPSKQGSEVTNLFFHLLG